MAPMLHAPGSTLRALDSETARLHYSRLHSTRFTGAGVTGSVVPKF